MIDIGEFQTKETQYWVKREKWEKQASSLEEEMNSLPQSAWA